MGDQGVQELTPICAKRFLFFFLQFQLTGFLYAEVTGEDGDTTGLRKDRAGDTGLLSERTSGYIVGQ